MSEVFLSRLHAAVPELDDDALSYFVSASVDEPLTRADVVSALGVLYDADTVARLADAVFDALATISTTGTSDVVAPPALAAPVTLARVEPMPERTAATGSSKYAVAGEWESIDALRSVERANARGAANAVQLVTSADLLAATHDPDPAKRKAAVKDLCPCHVRKDVPEFWARIAEMSVTDPDATVRLQAMHDLCDGSPPWMEDKVLECLRELEHDADTGIRKKARDVLTIYRHKGKWNVM